MRSMTGYGQASHQRAGRSLTVEVRAVNQRFLEVKLNMPREYLPWESELRSLVQERVARGKVDVGITRGAAGTDRVLVEPNVELARSYVAAWREIQRGVKLPGDIDLGFLQGRTELVRVVERRRDPEGEISRVRATLLRALEAFNRERSREGRALEKDMVARARRLVEIRRALAERVEELTPQFAARIRERVTALLEGAMVPEERLVQEAALLAERSDVTEELVRLDSHLRAFNALLRSKDVIGKKLDFLLQEIHREVNTVASKSADLRVTNLTLEARSEIEKLREQAQNVE